MYTGEIATIIVLLALVFWIFYRIRKAGKIVIKFCQESGIHIITINYRLFVPSFHFLFTSTFQLWFYAQLRNNEGDAKQVYIKVGHPLAGLLVPIIIIFEVDDEGGLTYRTKNTSIINVIFPNR